MSAVGLTAWAAFMCGINGGAYAWGGHHWWNLATAGLCAVAVAFRAVSK